MSRNHWDGLSVLVSGPDFHGYTEMVSEAFRQAGCLVYSHVWPQLTDDHLLRRVYFGARQRVTKHRDSAEAATLLLRRFQNLARGINADLRVLAGKFDPDLVLI